MTLVSSAEHMTRQWVWEAALAHVSAIKVRSTSAELGLKCLGSEVLQTPGSTETM